MSVGNQATLNAFSYEPGDKAFRSDFAKLVKTAYGQEDSGSSEEKKQESQAKENKLRESQVLQDKDINIFNYHSERIDTRKPSAHFLMEPDPLMSFRNEEGEVVNRPSSIHEAPSSMYHQMYSASSLKNCHEHFNQTNITKVGNNSKIELSFPSFLNISGEQRQEEVGEIEEVKVEEVDKDISMRFSSTGRKAPTIIEHTGQTSPRVPCKSTERSLLSDGFDLTQTMICGNNTNNR